MNVLLINGSPRGKNGCTYRVAAAFLDGIKEKENTIVEEFLVNDLDIKPCSGCFSCWNKTPGECVIKDDMKKVIEKILWADVIIWSFPLYYYSVPSKLKTLIDRKLPMEFPFMDRNAKTGGKIPRYDISNKKNVLISTCGFYTIEGNYDAVVSMFNRIFRTDKYEKIFCSEGGLFNTPKLAKKINDYLSHVKTAGQEFITGGIKEDTRTKLNTLLFSRETYENMADASWGIDKITGEKLDDSHVLINELAALYNKESYKRKDIILEIYYTDIEKQYQLILKENGCEVLTNNFKTYTTRIETSFTTFCDIATEKISAVEAILKQKFKIKGDFTIMLNLKKYFFDVNNKVGKTQELV